MLIQTFTQSLKLHYRQIYLQLSKTQVPKAAVSLLFSIQFQTPFLTFCQCSMLQNEFHRFDLGV